MSCLTLVAVLYHLTLVPPLPTPTATTHPSQVEAERAAVLADERASIERLLTAISTTLNCDLPAKLQEAVRGELAGMADGLAAGVAASVAPALQAAVAAALPKVRQPASAAPAAMACS